MKIMDVLKVVLPQRLFSVIALLRFMGIILVPNCGEANLANDPANNRWKYGLGTLLFGWGHGHLAVRSKGRWRCQILY